jgi:hypothetical protein
MVSVGVVMAIAGELMTAGVLVLIDPSVVIVGIVAAGDESVDSSR